MPTTSIWNHVPNESVSDILKRINLRQSVLTDLLNQFKTFDKYFSLIFEYYPDLIFILNEDHEILFANTTAQKQLEYSSNELIDCSIFNFIEEQEHEKIKQLMDQIKNNNNPFLTSVNNFFFITRWLKKDKTYDTILWKRIFYIADEKCYIAFASSISHYALPNPYINKVISDYIVISNIGVVITDYTLPHNPIIYINPIFEKNSGYKSDQLINQNCRILNQYDRNQAALHTLREAIKRKQSCQVLLKNFKPDKTEWYNFLTVYPFYSINGNDIIHFIGISYDFTSLVKEKHIIWDPSSLNGIGKILS